MSKQLPLAETPDVESPTSNVFAGPRLAPPKACPQVSENQARSVRSEPLEFGDASIMEDGSRMRLPHVLVALRGDAQSDELLDLLDRSASVTVLEGAGANLAQLSGLDPIDVAVVEPEFLNADFGVLLNDPNLGFPEIVFAINDVWSPQRYALSGRGIQYIVAVDQLLDWLLDSLPSLAALARARRFSFAANAHRPAPPELTDFRRNHRKMTLHRAETTFRETFFRALLAEHGARGKAAQEAGVPYRSFCEMLRKLGI